jgi:hypothetical protein
MTIARPEIVSAAGVHPNGSTARAPDASARDAER